MSLQRTALAMSAALAMTLVAGCASMERIRPSARKAQRSDANAALRQRVLELEQRATMAEVEIERLRRQVAELRDGSMQELTRDVSPSQAIEVVEELSSGTAVPVAPPPIEVIEIIDDSDEAAPSTGPEEVAQASPPVVSEAGQALYDKGYTLFHQGRYVDAEAVFQQFLASFRATDLGDNAQFWIGEARFARGDVSSALAAFREVVTAFPMGNKVADAMLKSADCLARLGDLNGAREGYAEVKESFPATAAAAVAEDRMRELE